MEANAHYYQLPMDAGLSLPFNDRHPVDRLVPVSWRDSKLVPRHVLHRAYVH